MAPATPKEQVYHLHPSGWENDPEEERFKLSLFDPIILVVYCHFALYFRLHDDAKEEAASVLQEGLEKTLSQVRHLCGTIEKDEGAGGFSFVKKKHTTVKYVVKRLDTPEYPSIDDIEDATFSCRALGGGGGGDLGLWGLLGEMPYGEGRPESNPHNSPSCSGFQLNLVRGGAVFSSHVHHWAADLVGWSNFVRQLADNCRAIHVARGNNNSKEIDFPPWDPACIDVSRFVRQLPPDSLIDGPPVAPRHPGHPPQDAYQALLFHLPRSKAARLKALATPKEDDGSPSSSSSSSCWVSTYDATCAFVWRHLTRVRIPYYNADPKDPAPWVGESVDMRPRFRDPAAATPRPTPRRMVRNMLAGGFSDAGPGLAAGPLPTVGEVAGIISGVDGDGDGDGNGVQQTQTQTQPLPLSALAGYIRRLTDSVTQPRVEELLGYIARLRDQQSVSFNLMSKPPMSFFVTDHRTADVAGCDFGFGAPITHRFLTGDNVSANMILIYPPARKTGGEGDDDEGTVWSITMEKELVPKLLEDPEWSGNPARLAGTRRRRRAEQEVHLRRAELVLQDHGLVHLREGEVLVVLVAEGVGQPEDAVKVLPHELPDPLRLDEVVVHGLGAERVRAQQDAPLDLRAEALAADARVEDSSSSI
ncbi:hypothetical protein VMCG_01641 [Cytospora schulzeri]|uniref:Trichothecene 3-O-acetyltransferase-like N-terminal domain-containing protein n=1 Tax=Cytospora schulzeri TaxID=448051 RepID=A0A423X3U4_9PEZI|nr:hypothetical protein VMCG_01641 [Valsa malicola]